MYTIKIIANILCCNINIVSNTFIELLAFDSRKIVLPDRTLFFALDSHRRSAHSFVLDAYKLGVRNFVLKR